MKQMLFIFFMFPMLCLSQAFYISPNGNDANNGSISSPWKTLFKATSTVTTAGSVINVMAGTYVETQKSNLKVGVSIEGDDKITTIIKGGMTGTWSSLLELQSNDGTDGKQSISNLTLDGQYVNSGNFKTWVAIWVTGRSNVSIHDCIIKNWKQSAVIFNGVNGDNFGTDAGKIHAKGNKFYNNTVTNSAAMYNGTGQGSLMLGFQNGMEIYNNTIQQIERPDFENGWPIKYWNQGWLKGVKIYNNILTKKPYSGTYPGENGGWDFCIEFFSIQGLEIYGNTIQGAIDLNYNYKGSYPYSAWIHDNNITHTVFNSKVEGAIILEFRTESAIIENNIINNKSSGISFNTRGISNKGGDRNNFDPIGYVPIGGFSYLTDIVIRNNLFKNMYEGQGIGNSFAIGVISEGTDDPQINNMRIYDNTIVGKSGNGSRIGLDFTSQPNGKCVDLYIQRNIVTGIKYGWLQGSNGRTNITNATVTDNDTWTNGNNTPVFPAGNPTGYIYQNNLSVNPQFDVNYISPLAIGYKNTAAPPQPVPCTSYTYGPWGSCDGVVEKRSLLSSSPAGCLQQPPPILMQSCTLPPIPVVDTIFCTVIVYYQATGNLTVRRATKWFMSKSDGYYDDKNFKMIGVHSYYNNKWVLKQ